MHCFRLLCLLSLYRGQPEHYRHENAPWPEIRGRSFLFVTTRRRPKSFTFQSNRNPAEAVDPPRSIRPEIQPPSADAVWDILEAAKETPYHGALVFLAFTGCRRGEALGLRWTDIDLKNSNTAIVQSLQRVKEKVWSFKHLSPRKADALFP